MNKIPLIILFTFIVAIETEADRYLQSIDVENNLGKYITKEINFTDELNRKQNLQLLLDKGVPLIIVMAYYECPMLCSLVLNGLSESINSSGLVPGVDFNILTLSIDPDETFELAMNKKNNYISNYFSSIDSDFWTFGTTSQKNINILSKDLGFNYSYDPSIDQFAHPAVVYVITQSGKISKQLFGIDIDSRNLKLSILEASNNKISSIFDKILLYCYRYNPEAGSYSMVASNVMKVAGASTVLIMSLCLSFFWFKEYKV